MANNNFLTFAGGSGANVLTQTAYAALTSTLANGFSSGTAQSPQLNKVWRQSSIIASVVAQLIADTTGQDAIDDGTTATLLANLKAGIKSLSNAVVGQTKNLKMSILTAATSGTITADEVVVETALGGQTYRIPSFSKTINLATTGAGGMDTGTAPVSGYVGIYAIYNPTTGVSALLAVNGATLLPEVYGGANMPSGYTASALVSVWPTNASSQLIAGSQYEREIARAAFVQVLSGSSLSSTWSPVGMTSAVPQNAKTVGGSLTLQATAGSGGIAINVASDANGTGTQSINGASSTTNGVGGAFSRLALSTVQLIYFSGLVNGPTTYTNVISINRYSI